MKLTPNPFAPPAAITQTLKLDTGEIELKSGSAVTRIWVDANQPVAHVEVTSTPPVVVEGQMELWRRDQIKLNQNAVGRAGFFEWGNNPEGLTFDPDTTFPSEGDRVTWAHFNTRSIYPLVFEREHLEALLSKYPDPLLHRWFGVTMKGSKSQRLDLYAFTQQAESPAAWKTAFDKVVASAGDLETARARDTLDRVFDFWNRSWLRVSGSPDADQVSQSYLIQRYMTACAGRGLQPIKFNGSLFSVGHDLPPGASSTENSHDPDYRAWGNSFWNQNTRMIYWPLLATGDYDLLAPWFNMYVQSLPLARDRTRAYFHHDGGAFIETIYFWGLPNVNDFGWNNPGPELQSEWMRYHVQGGLEVLAQMLDRYDYTQDADFARASLLPLADATITYYGQHWPRDPAGKIRLEPSQSIETYQKDAANPTPDLAGLMSVLPRLLALPPEFVNSTQRELWTKVLHDLPPLPFGTTAKGKLPPLGHGDPDGKRVILPAEKYGQPKNRENPELYHRLSLRPLRCRQAGSHARPRHVSRAPLSLRQMLGPGRHRGRLARFDRRGPQKRPSGIQVLWQPALPLVLVQEQRLDSRHGQRRRRHGDAPTHASPMRRPPHPAPARLARRLGGRFQTAGALPDHRRGPRAKWEDHPAQSHPRKPRP